MESAARQPAMVPKSHNHFFMQLGLADGASIVSSGNALWFVSFKRFEAWCAVAGAASVHLPHSRTSGS